MAKLMGKDINPVSLGVGLLVLYNLFVLPFTTSLLSIGISLIAYSLTKSLLLVLGILAVAPLLILSERVRMERFADTTDTAEKISDRVKALKETAAVSTGPVQQETMGVLESAEISNFQDVNADAAAAPPPDSIPAYVKQQGRMLLVPEFYVDRQENKDSNPKPQRILQNGEDTEAVSTALVPEGAQLEQAEAKAASSMTPTM
jgi:hypothetical protein